MAASCSTICSVRENSTRTGAGSMQRSCCVRLSTCTASTLSTGAPKVFVLDHILIFCNAVTSSQRTSSSMLDTGSRLPILEAPRSCMQLGKLTLKPQQLLLSKARPSPLHLLRINPELLALSEQPSTFRLNCWWRKLNQLESRPIGGHLAAFSSR